MSLPDLRDTTPPATSKALRRVVLYGMTRGLFEGLMGIRALLLAPLLGPAGVGAWALFRLGLRYSYLAGLGINRGLERETVRDGVLGGEAAGEETSRAALGFLLLVFVALAVVILGASSLVSDATLKAGLRGLAIAVLTRELIAYAFVYLRARGSLREYARIELWLATLHVVCTLGFAWFWGLPGAFAGYVFADLLTLAFALPRIPFRPVLSWPVIRRLLGIGLPVMLSSAAAMLLSTADRLVVAAVAGTEVLGYYAFAASIAGLAGSVAWVIRTVIVPDVYSHAAAAGAAQAVRHHLETMVLPYARVFPPMLGFAAIAIAPAVALVFPQFVPAVAPARVFVFTGVTFGLTNLGSLAVVAADRQSRLPLFAVGALVLNVALSWTLLETGRGLVAVAGGAVLCQGLYAAAVLDLSASAGGLPRVRYLVQVLAPLAWCTAVIAAIGALVPGGDVRSAGVAAGWYLLALLPLAPLLVREARTLRRLSGGEGSPPRGAEVRDGTRG